MLTITTNKEKVQGIADRTLKEYPLPITDFWTKRIVKLLDAGDERTILDSLTDERGTASSLEREVPFTAGGAASVSVMVTIRIAVLEQERTSGGTEGVDHCSVSRQMSEQAELNLRVVCIYQNTAFRSDKSSADFSSHLCPHRNVLQIRLTG